ncbi:MAG TPA: hypothetical protein VMA77_11520 [Solirubrobacteraceae bacterium]|nr:hypothetical protein [Solirubrobacteraceae bacterium]
MIGKPLSMRHPATRPSRRVPIGASAAVALLPPAAFAVHQLRYMLAFGGNAGIELQRTGHSYLHSVVPWLVVLMALVAGGFLRALGRAFEGHTSLPRYTSSLVGLWLACAACLVAIFAAQELLEGFFLTGHPAGWVGVFGYGGWWSIPAALCVGFVLAALLHGAHWVVRRVEESRSQVKRAWSGAPLPVARPLDVLVASPAPLVGGWSDRGPPKRG